MNHHFEPEVEPQDAFRPTRQQKKKSLFPQSRKNEGRRRGRIVLETETLRNNRQHECRRLWEIPDIPPRTESTCVFRFEQIVWSAQWLHLWYIVLFCVIQMRLLPLMSESLFCTIYRCVENTDSKIEHIRNSSLHLCPPPKASVCFVDHFIWKRNTPPS